MMNARWISSDTIEVPRRAEGDGVIGDGLAEIHPGDIEWDDWAAWLISQGKRRPGTGRRPGGQA